MARRRRPGTRPSEAIASIGPGLLNTSPDTVQRWLDELPADVRGGQACLLLQGALDWAGGRQAEAVDSPARGDAVRYTEAGDVTGMWLARFALADPLFVTGGIEEVVELAEGFDEEPALAAGFTPPAVAVYAAGALGALGRVRECEELSQAASRASPLRARAAAAPGVGVLRAPAVRWLRRARARAPRGRSASSSASTRSTGWP